MGPHVLERRLTVQKWTDDIFQCVKRRSYKNRVTQLWDNIVMASGSRRLATVVEE